MSHADRFVSLRLLTVAAFAVCIQSVCHSIVSKLTSPAKRLVCAWLIANAQKDPVPVLNAGTGS